MEFLSFATRQQIEERLTKNPGDEGAFMVCDLDHIRSNIERWNKVFPDVTPFYAVKCNSDLEILRVMADAGLGFDCASKAEMHAVLSLGVTPDRIIFANPCKMASHLKFAKDSGVEYMTFDNAEELKKMSKFNPNAKVLLRIAPDDSTAACRLSDKFGADLSDIASLLRYASTLDVEVVGVSYHVGSGATSIQSFVDAVHLARGAFDIAESLGFKFDILDIGGGFPGGVHNDLEEKPVDALTLERIGERVNPELKRLFPNTRIIAEPGRFMVLTCMTLMTSVIGKRVVQKSENSQSIMYYINDGVYGSFNNVMYDHATIIPDLWVHDWEIEGKTSSTSDEDEPVFDDEKNHPQVSSIWGPTCDGLDCVTKQCFLPDLEVGTWLMFNNMGAYTVAAGSNFNGMESPTMIYCNQN